MSGLITTLSPVVAGEATQVLLTTVALAVPGPKGDPGDAGPPMLASTALSGHRVVISEGDSLAAYASNADATHAGRVVGLTLGAADLGAEVSVRSLGEVVEPSWAWTPDAPVFLGTNGFLTQVAPVAPAAAFVLVVGIALSPTSMFVRLREPIFLA